MLFQKEKENTIILKIKREKVLSRFFVAKNNLLLKFNKMAVKVKLFKIDAKIITTVFRLVFIFLFINVIVYAESKFNFCVKFEKVVEVCAMAMGYTGVLLGLYYTNYNTLTTNNYKIASTEILKMLQEMPFFIDVLTSLILFIEILTTYIMIYMLNLFDINNRIGILSSLILSFGILYITFRYKHMTDKLIDYNNQLKISEDLLNSIIYDIKYLPKGYIDNIDIKSEIFIQKRKDIYNKISIIKRIILYSLKENKDYKAFAEHINIIINTIYIYQNFKRNIYCNSEWFPKKDIYSKYYDLDITTYDIANRTGSLPLNKIEIDNNWVENMLLDCINDLYLKLLEEKDFNNLIYYLEALHEIIPLQGYDIENNILFGTLKTQFDEFIMKIPEMPKEEIKILCIYERFAIVLEDILLAVKRMAINIDYVGTIEKSIRIIKNQEKNVLNRFTNSVDCYNLYISCKIEEENEKRIITPEKYLVENISAEIVKYFENIENLSINFIEYITNIARKEKVEKRFYAASILYYICINYVYKIENIEEMIQGKLKIIQQKYFIDLNRKKENRIGDIIKNEFGNIVKEFGEVIIQYKVSQSRDNGENMPDLFGYYINESLNYLLSCIENNNFSEYSKIFKQYIYIILYYQENIREEVIGKKYNSSFVVTSITKPFVKYCIIAGMALIYGLLNNDKKWVELVEEEFEEFYNSNNGRAKIEFLLECFSIYKKSLMNIGNDFNLNRSFLSVVDIKTRQYINSNGIYGYTYKTKDDLLNAFLNHRYTYKMQIEDIDEFYVLKIINNKVDNKKKYKSKYGWEKSEKD